MDQRDREFDDLFRSKLEGFEMEPSANVWPGVEGGLDSAKRRKSLTPWLSIAASIMLMIGIGLFFIPKKTPVVIKPHAKNAIAKTEQPAIASQPITTQPKQETAATSSRVNIKEHSEVARVKHNARATVYRAKNTDTTGATTRPLKTGQEQEIATVQQKPLMPAKPVVPDLPLSVKPIIDQLPAAGLKPDKLARQDIADAARDSISLKRRHKVHNFGDLVNLVVDKLDKRKDKVIQFADDDEGDSHLTGVNLGIVKIKKGE